MFDKILSNDWFILNHIPVPGDYDGFPVIAKPRKGSASQGLVVISSSDELSLFERKFVPAMDLESKHLSGLRLLFRQNFGFLRLFLKI